MTSLGETPTAASAVVSWMLAYVRRLAGKSAMSSIAGHMVQSLSEGIRGDDRVDDLPVGLRADVRAGDDGPAGMPGLPSRSLADGSRRAPPRSAPRSRAPFRACPRCVRAVGATTLHLRALRSVDCGPSGP